MRYKLYCLKLEKESIKNEQEEIKKIIDIINTHRLNKEIIKKCNNLLKRLKASFK